MTVLETGCGPGFFSVDIANMVGDSGKLIAADIQDEMLTKLENKIINNNNLKKRIKLHKSLNDKIGVTEKVDFVLIFYVLHEVPDQYSFLKEIKSLLKPESKALIVEPKFHVSKKDFDKSIELMKQLGFNLVEKPNVFFSRAVLING